MLLVTAACRDSLTGGELPHGSANIVAEAKTSSEDDTVFFSITNVGNIPIGFSCPYSLDRQIGSSWIEVTHFESQGCNAALILLQPGTSFNAVRTVSSIVPGSYRFRFAEVVDFEDGARGTSFPESLRVSNTFDVE